MTPVPAKGIHPLRSAMACQYMWPKQWGSPKDEWAANVWPRMVWLRIGARREIIRARKGSLIPQIMGTGSQNKLPTAETAKFLVFLRHTLGFPETY